MQTQFKVGDVVAIIKGEPTVPEVNNGLGMIGEIVEIDGIFARITSTQFVYHGYAKDSWWFKLDLIELVIEEKASVVSSVASSNICSRCGNQMVPKKSQGLLSGEFEVMKCESCGYCQ